MTEKLNSENESLNKSRKNSIENNQLSIKNQDTDSNSNTHHQNLRNRKRNKKIYNETNTEINNITKYNNKLPINQSIVEDLTDDNYTNLNMQKNVQLPDLAKNMSFEEYMTEYNKSLKQNLG